MSSGQKESYQNPYYQSPGPNAYVLPSTVGYKNHDMSRWRNPAYSMRTKSETTDKSFGPGPKYEIGQHTRFGKISTPKYTIRPRVNDLVGFKMPGPGTYSLEKSYVIKSNKPPAYSFGVKANISDKTFGPAPNAYSLPPNKTNPAYSLGNRLTTKITESSPGPAAISPPNLQVYKIKPPGFKMQAPTSQYITTSQPSPGPSAYNPMYNSSKSSPKFSFGIRHWEHALPYIVKEDNRC